MCACCSTFDPTCACSCHSRTHSPAHWPNQETTMTYIDPMADCHLPSSEHRARAEVLLASVRIGSREGDTTDDGTPIECFAGDDESDGLTTVHLLAALTHAVLALGGDS